MFLQLMDEPKLVALVGNAVQGLTTAIGSWGNKQSTTRCHCRKLSLHYILIHKLITCRRFPGPIFNHLFHWLCWNHRHVVHRCQLKPERTEGSWKGGLSDYYAVGSENINLWFKRRRVPYHLLGKSMTMMVSEIWTHFRLGASHQNQG